VEWEDKNCPCAHVLKVLIANYEKSLFKYFEAELTIKMHVRLELSCGAGGTYKIRPMRVKGNDQLSYFFEFIFQVQKQLNDLHSNKL
jgi:hypothetical protein